MTAPTHPLLKALFDLTREIARQNAHPQRPAIFPMPEAILDAAHAQVERTQDAQHPHPPGNANPV